METKQTSPFFIKIKGIAKKLLSAYRACTRLVTVHFQEKLTLDKLRDALQSKVQPSPACIDSTGTMASADFCKPSVNPVLQGSS